MSIIHCIQLLCRVGRGRGRGFRDYKLKKRGEVRGPPWGIKAASSIFKVLLQVWSTDQQLTPASPGSLLEMQILRPHPDLLKQTLWGGAPSEPVALQVILMSSKV